MCDLVLIGHPRVLFRDGFLGESVKFDILFRSLVGAFNPVNVRLQGLDPNWHSRVDICASLENNHLTGGWTRLEQVTFAGASLAPPVQTTSFGPRRPASLAPLKLVIEVQQPWHEPIPLKTGGHKIWLSNTSWHLFQRNSDQGRPQATFPNPGLVRAVVIVPSQKDRTDAYTTLQAEADKALGKQRSVHRLSFIDIKVAKPCSAQFSN